MPALASIFPARMNVWMLRPSASRLCSMTQAYYRAARSGSFATSAIRSLPWKWSSR